MPMDQSVFILHCPRCGGTCLQQTSGTPTREAFHSKPLWPSIGGAMASKDRPSKFQGGGETGLGSLSVGLQTNLTNPACLDKDKLCGLV